MHNQFNVKVENPLSKYTTFVIPIVLRFNNKKKNLLSDYYLAGCLFNDIFEIDPYDIQEIK